MNKALIKLAARNQSGFTLIELLVVIIIIGILAAIALPSFLNQAAKAKQAEAKSYIGAINRSQQTYRIENQSFAADIPSLELGIPTDTTDYLYLIAPSSDLERQSQTVANAQAKDGTTLRSYSGGVVVWSSGQTAAIACETDTVSDDPPGAILTPQASDTGEPVACPEGSRVMR